MQACAEAGEAVTKFKDISGAFNKVQATIDSCKTVDQLYFAQRLGNIHLRRLKGQHKKDVEAVYWNLFKWKIGELSPRSVR